MGQQQLLLVILVTIIVGIATVVAINTFSSAADSANLDAVRQDMISMASSAQGFYMKPGMMNGGANTFDGTSGNEITMSNLNCPGDVSGAICTNENGTYELTSTSSGQFVLTADPSSGTGYVRGETGNTDNTQTLTVFPDDASFTN